MRTERRSAAVLSLVAGATFALGSTPPFEDVAAALWLLGFVCVIGAGVLTHIADSGAPRHSSR